MSALGHKLTFATHKRVSAKGQKRALSYLQRANFSASQHEAKVHRHWTSWKVSSEPSLENSLTIPLNEVEWCNGMAIFLFRSGHPVLYRVHTFVRLTLVVHARVRREALRHRFERAGIFNLNVMLNGSRELNGHYSSPIKRSLR